MHLRTDHDAAPTLKSKLRAHLRRPSLGPELRGLTGPILLVIAQLWVIGFRKGGSRAAAYIERRYDPHRRLYNAGAVT